MITQSEHNMEPPPEKRLTRLQDQYVNWSNTTEQEEICSDYLDYCKGWWWFNNAVEETQISIIDYVEKLPGFWDWLE
jgi:hypothetical protein